MSITRLFAGVAFASAFMSLAPVAMSQGMPALHVVTDPAGAPAGEYALDTHHASVTLKLAHMGLSHYTMHFTKMQGGYTYNPAHPDATKVSLTIDPNSIQTDDPDFNTEIAEKFLETAKYPTLTFVSTGITRTGDHGKMTGDLTFHGVTKPVTLNVDYRGFVAMMGQQHMGFSAETTIKRTDFGAGAYVPVVGDDVTVLVEVEFVKK